ncbi:STAS/SEC14 domain-containing protein [Pontibacter burrus]|uniref:STAS/SEC14 domain-containing protein n=1 Tax=Pontibacter burrus TaxID=2704466 RepID=A0A6B3LRM8_9BACT|nr:STAS/SEC14 domain-containing protein [Pontibacter burrus]NEM97705.1 hypothetical protein [Pontibacter burrus]
MILYSDHIIQLDYIPDDDVLVTSLQEERDYNADDVRSAFRSIAAYIKEYNISRLLLDFRRNTLDLAIGEYKFTVAQLTVGLLQTSLQRVARVGTDDPKRENKIQTMYEEIKAAVPIPIAVRMFPSWQEAYDWLTEE